MSRSRRRKRLEMTVEAVARYAGDALERSSRGERAYLHSVAHLVALVDDPLFDSPLTCLNYFVAAYTEALLGRDNTEDEVAAGAHWTDADAAHVAALVRAHHSLADARAKLVSATAWMQMGR